MYCTHCAKHINEDKLEAKRPSLPMGEEVPTDAKVAYECPRCGHLIHADLEEEEVKSLARAAHAQVQRARNSLNSGMGAGAVGLILLIIGILFYFLACKPSNQYQLVTTCAEFYVSVTLISISVILLAFGIWRVTKGIIVAQTNRHLLRDINNQTFHQ